MNIALSVEMVLERQLNHRHTHTDFLTHTNTHRLVNVNNLKNTTVYVYVVQL